VGGGKKNNMEKNKGNTPTSTRESEKQAKTNPSGGLGGRKNILQVHGPRGSVKGKTGRGIALSTAQREEVSPL